MGEARVYEAAQTADLPAIGRMISHAFGTVREAAVEWITSSGLSQVRVLRESVGTEASGCFVLIPMGQFFGGKSVPMVGIAGVAVPPEARGRGIAREMMGRCMRELHAQGVVLSGLYCSTQALYRQVGFEAAGAQFSTKVATSRLELAGTDGSAKSGSAVGKGRRMVPLGEAEMGEVKECRRRFACGINGELDRGDYIWRRVNHLRGLAFYGFAVRGPSGSLDGYVFIGHEREGTALRHGLVVSDLAFLTPEAGRQIVRFLADFEPTVEWVRMPGGPVHPLVMLLSQQRFTVEFKDYWMTRIVRVEEALRARGYSEYVRASVVLEVEDALLPENSGAYAVDVEGGVARVKRVGGGEVGAGGGVVRCGVRGLAAMYTGFVTPREAVLAGLCEGDEAGLAAMAALFGDGLPRMTDSF